MYGPRGVWIEGPRCLVVIATLLERSLPKSLLSELRQADPGIDGYIERLIVHPSLTTSQIHDDLLKAYHETRYDVFGTSPSPLMTLQIGKVNARLQRAYRKFGVNSTIFITAFNPLGEKLSAAENMARHKELVELLEFGRYPNWEGRGYRPSGDWEETSALALGVSRHFARWLGNKFNQNAVVWAGVDAVPRLVLLR